MAAFDIIVWANNREKRASSAASTFDFQSIRIGTDALTISDVAGALSINGALLTGLANGAAAADAVNFGQLALKQDAATAVTTGGTHPFLAAQSMGGFKLTNVAAGTATGDAVNYDQLILKQDAATAVNTAGTHAFTAAQSMGSNKLTSVAAGTATGDAVNYDQLILKQDAATAVTTGGTHPFLAAQSMGGFKLTSVAQGTATGDAVNYDQLILKQDMSTAVNTGGTNAFTAAQSMGGFKLTNVATPSAAADAANKSYVDAVATGLDPKAAVNAATTGPLPANVYNNGASGVGATLTGSANGALPAIDGYSPVVGDRLLIKDEATQANNGLYVVTALGSAGAAYVLTRSTDADTSQPAANPKVTGGLYTIVFGGTANKGYGFVETTSDPITLGTTALVFQKFSSPTTTLGAGDGIAVSGTTISADYTRTLTNDNAGTISKAQIVYIKANGNVDLAIAQVVSDSFELGVVYDPSIAAAAAGKITIRRGAVIPGFSGLTVGAPVYVSRATAGATTQALTGFVAGEFIYRVGYAVSATEVIYNPRFILEY